MDFYVLRHLLSYKKSSVFSTGFLILFQILLREVTINQPLFTLLMDIKNDVTVKWIIINSLGQNTKKIIEDHGKTAYQIWKVLKK